MDGEERQALEEDDRLLYEDLKRIMKELLFNGAKREIRGSFELSSGSPNADREASLSQSTVRKVTPFQLLYHVVEDLPPREFRSLRVILVSLESLILLCRMYKRVANAWRCIDH
jgi:hypothetical protein